MSGWNGLSKSLSYTGARTLTDDEVQLWDRLCDGSAIAGKFPMFVMPVSEVLKLDELQPHEELKDKLVEWKPGMGKVLFCSHTWLKYKHPDDDAKSKITMLKRILVRIREKTIGDLPFWGAYYDPVQIKAKELYRDLANGYVWFDVMSIPQADPVMMRNAVSSIVRYVSDSAYLRHRAGRGAHLQGDDPVKSRGSARRGASTAQQAAPPPLRFAGVGLERPRRVVALQREVLEAPLLRPRRLRGDLLGGALARATAGPVLGGDAVLVRGADRRELLGHAPQADAREEGARAAHGASDGGWRGARATTRVCASW